MTIKSQGQRRLLRAQAVAVVVFVAATLGAMPFVDRLLDTSLAWVPAHAEATGVVTDLTYAVEEYRGLEGHTRSRTNHYMNYAFLLDDQRFTRFIEISEATYDAHQLDDPISVWYDPESPRTNLPADIARAEQGSDDPFGRLTMVAPYTLGLGAFIFAVLNFFYVRESARKLAEGFYTESSWLDIDDRQLVFLAGSELGYVEFEKSRTRALQKAFQEGASVATLITLAKAKDKEITNIRLSEVTKLVSRHDKDTIDIEVGDQSHSIEFLNAATKAHALDRIGPCVPAALAAVNVRKSRLASALPALVVLLVLTAVAVGVGDAAIALMIGVFALLKVVPTLVRRLLDPTRLHEWLPDADDADVPEAAPG